MRGSDYRFLKLTDKSFFIFNPFAPVTANHNEGESQFSGLIRQAHSFPLHLPKAPDNSPIDRKNRTNR